MALIVNGQISIMINLSPYGPILTYLDKVIEADSELQAVSDIDTN